MAQKILAHLQVMPQFLTCMFPFGQREHGHDSSDSSFQSSNRLTMPQIGLQIPCIGRSGRQLEHCYSLRSIERSASQPEWPWSPRLCSIYHSFDLEFGSSNWIVVKANRLIQRLVRDVDKSNSQTQPTACVPATRIAQALQIHGMIATWCGDNWPWYITFLEGTLQGMTRSTLAATMETEQIPLDFVEIATPPMSLSFPSSQSGEFEEKPTKLRKATSSFRSYADRIPIFTNSRDSQSKSPHAQQVPVVQHAFSFKDLPRVHYIEERANEVLTILENNKEVLEDLKRDYEAVFAETKELQDTSESRVALAQFVKVVDHVQRDMCRQRTRVERLLRLLASRKTLVSRIVRGQQTKSSAYNL
jgi:hypothetical protein